MSGGQFDWGGRLNGRISPDSSWGLSVVMLEANRLYAGIPVYPTVLFGVKI